MVQLNFEKQGGLIPVIVRHYQTGQVLMLAYMNQDAYEKTLEYQANALLESFSPGALA